MPSARRFARRVDARHGGPTGNPAAFKRERRAAGTRAHAARRLRHAGVHAGGHGGGHEGTHARAGAFHRQPDHPEQHAALHAAARRRAHRAFRFEPRLHAVERPHPDGLGWLPGLLHGRHPDARRRWRHLLVVRRWREGSHDARSEHPRAEPDRRGHHHGLRRLPARGSRSADGARARGDASQRGVAAPLQGGARSPRCAGAVRHRAGWHASRTAQGECRAHLRDRAARLCHRRRGGGRESGTHRRHRALHRATAARRKASLPDGCRLSARHRHRRRRRRGHVRLRAADAAFTREGALRLRNARFADDQAPIEADCDCQTCAGGFSRAYLRHLFSAGEMLGPTLVSLHNVRLYQRLMLAIRRAIGCNAWSALETDWPCLSAAREQTTGDPE